MRMHSSRAASAAARHYHKQSTLLAACLAPLECIKCCFKVCHGTPARHPSRLLLLLLLWLLLP